MAIVPTVFVLPDSAMPTIIPNPISFSLVFVSVSLASKKEKGPMLISSENICL